MLLLWIPLRQWPGLGTVANVIVIGLATDATLALLEAPDPMAARVALLLGGIVLNGLAGALYIGSQFGPGPRDGLMTGLVRRTGRSFRLVRTSIEITVLVVGWLMGGVVGLGTVLYAVLIGPVVQVFLPHLHRAAGRAAPAAAEGRSGGGSRRRRRQASRASTKGSTPEAPARRSAAAATVRVQRELATSSTSRTGPSSPRSADACSGPTSSRPQTPASRKALLPPGLADRPAVHRVEGAEPLHAAHLGDAPGQRLDELRAGAGGHHRDGHRALRPAPVAQDRHAGPQQLGRHLGVGVPAAGCAAAVPSRGRSAAPPPARSPCASSGLILPLTGTPEAVHARRPLGARTPARHPPAPAGPGRS